MLACPIFREYFSRKGFQLLRSFPRSSMVRTVGDRKHCGPRKKPASFFLAMSCFFWNSAWQQPFWTPSAGGWSYFSVTRPVTSADLLLKPVDGSFVSTIHFSRISRCFGEKSCLITSFRTSRGKPLNKSRIRSKNLACWDSHDFAFGALPASDGWLLLAALS